MTREEANKFQEKREELHKTLKELRESEAGADKAYKDARAAGDFKAMKIARKSRRAFSELIDTATQQLIATPVVNESLIKE